MKPHMGLFINNYGSGTIDNQLFFVHSNIVFTGIVFNIVLIFLVSLSRKLRSVQGISFVFNLSCANCMFSTLALTTGFISENNIAYSKETCNVLTATTTFTCVAASLSRSVIALDRYIYISDPLHYYIRSPETKIFCLIVCLWIAAGCLSLTPYISDFLIRGSDSTDDGCLPVPAHWYVICIVSMGILMPLVYEVFVYTRIFYWACLHIQIMKQEANYRSELRQRSVKDSYKLDISQLELFTRASLLMTASVFPARDSGTEIDNASQSTISEAPVTPWIHTLRRVTMTSNVTSYVNSLLKNTSTHKINDPVESKETLSDRKKEYEHVPAVTFVGSNIDRHSEGGQRPNLNVSFSTQLNPNNVHLEDIWADEEFEKLSKSVGGYRKNLGAQTLSTAIQKLLTCTELKAGCILLVILGTAVGCWIPFIAVFVCELMGFDEDSIVTQRKVANLFIYSLSCLDPIVYDLLHQPIRTAVKEEIRTSLTIRDY